MSRNQWGNSNDAETSSSDSNNFWSASDAVHSSASEQQDSWQSSSEGASSVSGEQPGEETQVLDSTQVQEVTSQPEAVSETQAIPVVSGDSAGGATRSVTSTPPPPFTPVPSSGIPSEQPKSKGRGTITAMLVVIALALLAIAGILGYKNFYEDDSDTTAATADADALVEEAPEADASADDAAEEVVTVTEEEDTHRPSTTVVLTAIPEAATTTATRTTTTTVTTATATQAAGSSICDGRGVLIIASEYSYADATAHLSSNPNAQVINPGTCPSLRARYNGNDVYAVVIDYGSDLSSLCAAEAQGRGNARILNQTSNWNTPC